MLLLTRTDALRVMPYFAGRPSQDCLVFEQTCFALRQIILTHSKEIPFNDVGNGSGIGIGLLLGHNVCPGA
jgi:hypothetical protein